MYITECGKGFILGVFLIKIEKVGAETFSGHLPVSRVVLVAVVFFLLVGVLFLVLFISYHSPVHPKYATTRPKFALTKHLVCAHRDLLGRLLDKFRFRHVHFRVSKLVHERHDLGSFHRHENERRRDR